MQKSEKNCFGMKQNNTTRHQVKVGKHECTKIGATNKTEKNGKIKLNQLIYSVLLFNNSAILQ